jgi:predicted nucleic acid-binding protein
MNAKAFFDTNVLLYIYGEDIPKGTRARALFDEYTQSGDILVSTQVVQEFYAAGSRKLGMPRHQLREIVLALLDLPLIIVTSSHITQALDCEMKYKISFWDALILAAAEAGGAELLYTEDLSHGQKYGAVLVRNPFLPES